MAQVVKSTSRPSAHPVSPAASRPAAKPGRQRIRLYLQVGAALAAMGVLVGGFFLIKDQFSISGRPDMAQYQPNSIPQVASQNVSAPVSKQAGRVWINKVVLTNESFAPSPDLLASASVAGGAIAMSVDRSTADPLLEMQRRESESATAASNASDGGEVHIATGFEGSPPMNVVRISPTHYCLTINTHQFQDWFMFRVTGAKGKLLRIDIKTSDSQKHPWSTLNPVMINSDQLGDATLYQSKYLDKAHATSGATRAWNGSLLPADSIQQWHFIPNCWMANDETFSMVQRFDGDIATVAMRVPFTAALLDQLMADWQTRHEVQVVEVGRSRQGRPLRVVQISDNMSDNSRPCILIYAGEHADEQDCMWAASGAVRELLSDTQFARTMRHRFTFLVIPQLDPDCSAAALHTGINITFMSDRETPESKAYANWFQNWVQDGNRLDIAIDLHNVQSSEMPTHIMCAWMEGVGQRGELCTAFHDSLIKQSLRGGVLINRNSPRRGWAPDRLGGWLSRRYGPLSLLYEVNSQEPQRHLSITQTQYLGALFVRAAGDWLDGPASVALMNEIDARRQERTERWAQHQADVPPGSSAIVAEAIVSRGVGLATPSNKGETWIP